MDSLLAVRESDKQNLKRDLTRANAKIIQLASEAQTLRNQVTSRLHVLCTTCQTPFFATHRSMYLNHG